MSTKILKSKFYLANGMDVYLEHGAFKSMSAADDRMYFVASRTATELRMERKPEFRGFRAVSGRHILARPNKYYIHP